MDKGVEGSGKDQRMGKRSFLRHEKDLHEKDEICISPHE